MTVRVVFTEPSLRDKEEPDLPPLIAGRDLVNNLFPEPSTEIKEPPLSKQGKGPVCEEELLGVSSYPNIYGHRWIAPAKNLQPFGANWPGAMPR